MDIDKLINLFIGNLRSFNILHKYSKQPLPQSCPHCGHEFKGKERILYITCKKCGDRGYNKKKLLKKVEKIKQTTAWNPLAQCIVCGEKPPRVLPTGYLSHNYCDYCKQPINFPV